MQSSMGTDTGRDGLTTLHCSPVNTVAQRRCCRNLTSPPLVGTEQRLKDLLGLVSLGAADALGGEEAHVEVHGDAGLPALVNLGLTLEVDAVDLVAEPIDAQHDGRGHRDHEAMIPHAELVQDGAERNVLAAMQLTDGEEALADGFDQDHALHVGAPVIRSQVGRVVRQQLAAPLLVADGFRFRDRDVACETLVGGGR